MATLNIFETIQMYSDSQLSSNPQKVLPDWNPKYSLVPVTNPKADQFQINPGASFTPFSGSIPTSIDGTTLFSTSINYIIPNTYRFTWTGGTNPVLKTNRNLTLATSMVTITINNNVLATFVISGGGTWGTATAGDLLWLPGPTTGDGSTPFNVLNQGLWSVLNVSSSTQLTAVRLAGVPFQGVSESQTVGSNGQLVAFAPSGIQIGNKVNISAGFSPVDFGTYVITNVVPSFFEVQTGTALALETNVMPTATGLVFYSTAKRFLRVETDQMATLQLNGVSPSGIQLAPLVVADPGNTAFFELWGTAWSLTVVNQSPGNVLNLTVISAE
jgi:hypothetical protein